MSLKTVFAHIAAFFSSSNLTAIEKFVSDVSPVIGADLAAFMGTLPAAFTSLEQAAEKAIELLNDAKGIVMSKDLAIAVAQNIFGAKTVNIVEEAEELLKQL